MLPLVGLTMYHAIPALLFAGLLSKLTAVSRDPQSLPLAYMTCCMRVSFESGRPISSVSGELTTSAQQPTKPLNSTVVVSLMQAPSGTSGVVVLSARVAEPGCCCFGGIPYCATVNTLFVRLRVGDAVFSEDVFDSVQTIRFVEEPVKAVPAAS